MFRFLTIVFIVMFSCVLFGEELTKAEKAQRNFNSIQRVYQKGTPHTDKSGNVLYAYDKESSFFPIMLWGVDRHSKKCDWRIIKKAGFNTVWPRHVYKGVLGSAKRMDLQVILMGKLKTDRLKATKNNPHFFGNVYMDEPIAHFGSADMDKLFKKYSEYKKLFKSICGKKLIFINDAPWITPPATSWWVKWSRSGDVSCHDNYPIKTHRHLQRSIASAANGIPQSISLAVSANKQKKPVWIIVGAFSQPLTRPYSAFPYRFPSIMQLRSQVYSALIHGATGISYFIWDGWISRDGKVIGMSPDPKVTYTGRMKANPNELIQAKALWEMTVQINKELNVLAPAILSPTAGDDVKYSVDIKGRKTISDVPIACLLKKHPDGGYVLLTTNNDDAVLTVIYKFEKKLDNVKAMFENRTTLKKVNDKIFKIVYEPFESHVIRINAK